jgi:hypothetical protein
MAKITDDSQFWQESKHLIKPSVSAPDLVDIAIDVVDTNQIGLDRLIKFREKNSPHNVALRSKFRMHIVQQIQAINQLEPGDFLRWKEEFRRTCQDDYAALQEELKMSAISIPTGGHSTNVSLGQPACSRVTISIEKEFFIPR